MLAVTYHDSLLWVDCRPFPGDLNVPEAVIAMELFGDVLSRHHSCGKKLGGGKLRQHLTFPVRCPYFCARKTTDDYKRN
jgi:hypothetical protein